MLRLLSLCSLASLLSLAAASPVGADACLSSMEAFSVAEGHPTPPAGPMERVVETRATPLEAPPLEPLAWCETPDDPRCAPAKGPDAPSWHGGSELFRTAPGASWVPSPRGRPVSRSAHLGHSPAEGVRERLDRPPR